MEVATPVMTIGFPLDLPETPSFGMVAGFDRKFLGRYFCTTHVRVNLPTQRGEAGAPLLNFKGEVIGILVAQHRQWLGLLRACPSTPRKKFGTTSSASAKHAMAGLGSMSHAAEKPVEGSTAEMTEIIKDTPAFGSGVQTGDILLQVGKTKVHQPEDVIDASFFITAGDTVPITVMRGNEKADLRGPGRFSSCEPSCAACIACSGLEWNSAADRRHAPNAVTVSSVALDDSATA